MAASILSAACSGGADFTLGDLVFEKEEPRHDLCSGGQTMPGVMGGWVCSCPCHRASGVTSEGEETSS